jgi:hypothetical protein
MQAKVRQMIQEEEQRGRELSKRSRSYRARPSTTCSVDRLHRQRLSSSTSKPETHSYHSVAPSFHPPQLSRGSTTSTSKALWPRNSKHRLGLPTSGLAPTLNTMAVLTWHNTSSATRLSSHRQEGTTPQWPNPSSSHSKAQP